MWTTAVLRVVAGIGCVGILLISPAKYIKLPQCTSMKNSRKRWAFTTYDYKIDYSVN